MRDVLLMKRVQKLVSLLCVMAMLLAMSSFSIGVAKSASANSADGESQLSLISGTYYRYPIRTFPVS